MADASGNPSGGYYSGRPLGLQFDDQQQAQAVPAAPPPPSQPQATTGEQANGVPAPPPQLQAPQDVGDQVANHTQVHGVPGYYKGRVNTNTNSAVAPLSAAATVAPPAPPPPPAAPAVEPERKLSWIDKLLMCFTSGGNAR